MDNNLLLKDIFSTQATVDLLEALFSTTMITRGKEFVNEKRVSKITYDQDRDRIVAIIKDIKTYRVSVSCSHSDQLVEVICTCPVGDGYFDSDCKHAAAVIMILSKYFMALGKTTKLLSTYYKNMLDELFNQAEVRDETIIKMEVPQKPVLLINNHANVAYPVITLFDLEGKADDVAVILSTHKSIYFDQIFSDLMTFSDRFEYMLNVANGPLKLTICSDTAWVPQWKINIVDQMVNIQFVCIDSNGSHYYCMPLGNTHVVDIKTGKVVALQVNHAACYQLFAKKFCTIIPFFKKKNLDAYAMIGNKIAGKVFSSLFKKTVCFPEWPEDGKWSVSLKDFSINFCGTVSCSIDHVFDHIIFSPFINQISTYTKRIDISTDDDYSFDNQVNLVASVMAGQQIIAVTQGQAQESCYKILNHVVRPFQQHYLSYIDAALHYIKHSINDSALLSEDEQQAQFFATITEDTDESKEVLFKKFLNSVQMIRDNRYFYVQYDDNGQMYFGFFSELVFLYVTLITVKFIKKSCGTVDIYGGNGKFNISLPEEYSKKTYVKDLLYYAKSLDVVIYQANKKLKIRSLTVSLDVSSDLDWFSIAPDFYENGVLVTESDWQYWLAQGSDRYVVGNEVQVFDEKTTDMLVALRALHNDYKKNEIYSTKKVMYEIPRLHVFTLFALKKAGVVTKLSNSDEKIIEVLYNFTAIPLQDTPDALMCILHDYQIKGYEWLAFLYQNKFGACLADEMGLGKTVQIIAFLAGIYEKKIIPVSEYVATIHLIVAPATVIGNWEHEITRFYPAFKVLLYVGPKRSLESAETCDIILTTYDVLRADQEILNTMMFDVVVFDEAQAIKNKSSQKNDAAVKVKGMFKVCVTGTPLENNITEFCTLLNMALPGLIDEKTIDMREVKKGNYTLIQKRIAPFILRRTKKEYLAHLPQKNEEDHYLEMTTIQKSFYGVIVDEVKQEVYRAYREKSGAQAGIVALTALLRLRQICISPALVSDQIKDVSPKISYLLDDLVKLQEQKISVLIFSQFTKALDIISTELGKQKILFYRIDGSVPVLDRKKLVQSFQSKDSNVLVFLLSLKTGGVGLTLTRAQVVYHLDPWWNPAVENQASDRVHRMGQENEVRIVRLLMKDSIEEKMLVLKQQKEALFNSIMRGSLGAKDTLLTKEDFDFLLS